MLPVFWFGLACLSVVLTWLYRNGGGVLAVVVWHGTYNVVAGTAAAQSGANVIITVVIMLAAVLIVGLGIRDGSLITRPDRTTVTPGRHIDRPDPFNYLEIEPGSGPRPDRCPAGSGRSLRPKVDHSGSRASFLVR